MKPYPSNQPPTDFGSQVPRLVSADEPILADAPTTLAGQLAKEMRQRWKRGERPLTEEFLSDNPELCQQPTSAMEIIYEEILLRQERGQKDVWADVFCRFPQWHDQLQALQDCHRLLDSPQGTPQFPDVGESLGEFRLLAEMGRGAEGRVFLATQPALANRLVVLKVTPRAGQEHLSLARLQHTNIVPLYFARDDRARQLRVLCMPYFGGATLSDVMRALAEIPWSQRTGRLLIDAVDRLQSALPGVASSVSGPRRFFNRATYIQAICWIGASCAEALHYAHERGLLHLDLKPSNLLIAGDGQPMLLDFHLANAPILPNNPLPDRLGGTPAYMAPEQRTAAEAMGACDPGSNPVDTRADIYGLGALLYEALGGQLPFQHGSSSSLRSINFQVSVGLSDIVDRCLAFPAADRYPDAAALATDLRRHMTDRPLLGVRNRSPAERWHKWRSRQPAALRFILLLGLTVSTTLALTVGVWLYWAERIHEAELALAEGTRQMRDQQHYDDASVTLRHGLALVQNIPFGGDLAQQLGRQLEKAAAERDRASLNRLARELHSQVEQMRVLFGMDITPSPQLNGIIATCRELWSKRTLIASSLGTNTVADLSELALLWADLRVRSATAAEFSGACHEAFKVLAEANEIFGASSAFVYEETRYLRALGLPTSPSTQSIPAKELWEHYALGRSYLRAGDPQRAAEELKNAQLRQPHDCWVNYYYGLCAYRLHQYEDAARAFSVCIGAAPDLAGVYYNRAMAFTALRRTELALRDLDRALELDPTLAAAVLNRGMLRLQEKRYANATSDLQQALKLGASPSTVHYDLALIDLAQNKRGEALVHVHHALQSSPAHQEARQLLEKLEKLDKK